MNFIFTCPIDGHYRFEWENQEGLCFCMRFMKAGDEFQFSHDSIPESRNGRLVA